MTSKEIVKRAIHFKNPPRIPYNFDSNRTPTPLEHSYGDDFTWCFLDKPVDFIEINQDGDKVDEWGCIWKTMGETFGEPTTFPLEGLEVFDDILIPNYLDPERYKSIRKAVQENTQEKYMLAMMPVGIFQIMIHLFGFEDFMYQVAGNTENYEKLATKLTDIAIQVIELFADCGVDGIILIEDMGLQDRMMISPQMWKDIYYPLYSRMFDYAHGKGLDVMSHTCGHIMDILGLYIDAGLDVIQLDQQDNMGLENLSNNFKGEVCFFNCLDIQTSLSLSESELKEQAINMANILGTPNGGFMAKTYPQPNALRITHEYMQSMSDGFKSVQL